MEVDRLSWLAFCPTFSVIIFVTYVNTCTEIGKLLPMHTKNDVIQEAA
jgi:hypothetical protein